MLFLRFITTLLLYLPSVSLAADTSAWRSRSIYFVLTDRIARSSSDTGGSACSDLDDYCGGTFQGLESKLGYIQGLGFDAIWITPVVANSAGGYHGYWAQDLYAVNSNYGTAADLKSLVSAAHAKGMYVMVDVVANHMGYGAIEDNRPAPLNETTSYHSICEINYDSQTSIEECRIDNLPDVDTESSELQTLYNTWVNWLVTEYSFDGVRIDTVKHVQQDFWPAFASAAGVYAIGEVFDGDPAYDVAYAELMPGQLNYANYYPMNSFYQQNGSAQALVDMMDTIKNTYPDPTALGTFLDNHDNPRWLDQKNDVTLLKNALAFVILSRGIPILYYGTEQGFSGGTDNGGNREDLWRSSFSTNTDLYQAIQKLTGARASAGGLAGNDHTHLYVTSDAYAWSRANGDLVVLTTNVGAGSNAQYCFNSQKANGKWTNVFDSGTVTADGSGNLCVNVVNGHPVVLVASVVAAAVPTSSGSPTTNPVPTTLRTATSAACPTSVSVTFTDSVVTAVGDTIRIAGNTTQLGNWNPSNAPTLSASQYTSSNPVWTVTLPMAAGSVVQYKFVKLSSGGAVTWESDPNRAYTVPACQANAAVSSQWQ